LYVAIQIAAIVNSGLSFMTGCRTSIRRSKTVSASVTHGVHISHFIGRASHLAAVVSALIRAAMGGWRRSFGIDLGVRHTRVPGQHKDQPPIGWRQVS